MGIFSRIICRLSMVASLFMVAGCATNSQPVQISTGTSTLVLSTQVDQGFKPQNVVNQFSLNNKIFAFLTIYDDSNSRLPAVLEARWYNNAGFVVGRKFTPNYKGLPHRLWFSVDASDIGVGAGRVEILDGDRIILESTFEVLDKRSNLIFTAN